MYTEVYIVFIFVYFHVILPYLVTTPLDYIYFSRTSIGDALPLALPCIGGRSVVVCHAIILSTCLPIVGVVNIQVRLGLSDFPSSGVNV